MTVIPKDYTTMIPVDYMTMIQEYTVMLSSLHGVSTGHAPGSGRSACERRGAGGEPDGLVGGEVVSTALSQGRMEEYVSGGSVDSYLASVNNILDNEAGPGHSNRGPPAVSVVCVEKTGELNVATKMSSASERTVRKSQLMSPPSRKKGGASSKENLGELKKLGCIAEESNINDPGKRSDQIVTFQTVFDQISPCSKA
nr:hypothetical protein BaRGS_021155 [Batillaria attramentaria]